MTWRSRLSLIGRLIVAIAFGAGMLLISGSAAAAQTTPDSPSPCGGLGPYWIGARTGTISIQGAQAEVQRYDPRVCDETFAWSLMANSSQPSDEVAQVGWLK